MTRVFDLRTLAVTLALVLTTSTASAVPLIYTFSGVVDSADYPLNKSWPPGTPSFPLGTPFSVSFLIDSMASPQSTYPTFAQYEPQALEANAGSYQMVPSALPSITVRNDNSNQDVVYFNTYVTGEEIGTAGTSVVDEIYVRLEDESATAFDSTALPLQLDLADFSDARFTIYFIANTVDLLTVEGPITSITVTPVPEPQSCTLLGTALLGLVVYTRRRRRTA